MEHYILFSLAVIAAFVAIGIWVAFDATPIDYESTDEDNEFKKLYTELDALESEVSHIDRHKIAQFMLNYGQKQYKEGFEMGQQIKLQEPLSESDGVAESIMKNQQGACL